MSIGSLFLIILAALVGVWTAGSVHGRTVLPFAMALALGVWLYYRWLTPRPRVRR